MMDGRTNTKHPANTVQSIFTGSFTMKRTSQTGQLLFYSVLGTMSFNTPTPKHTVSRSLRANKKSKSLQNVLV
jgi:hypothetical protein